MGLKTGNKYRAVNFAHDLTVIGKCGKRYAATYIDAYGDKQVLIYKRDKDRSTLAPGDRSIVNNGKIYSTPIKESFNE